MQRVGFGSLQFGIGKTKAACTFGFADNGTKRTAYIVFFAAKRQAKSLFGLGNEEATRTCRGTEHRRRIEPFEVGEPLAKHGCYEVFYVSIAHIASLGFLRKRCGGVFHVKTSQNYWLFAILFYGHNHAFVVGHGVIDALRRVLGCGNGREQLLNLGLDGIYVDVAHHYDGLQVGTIPLVIIILEVLVGKVVNDVHRADGHAVFVFRALKDGGL